MCAKVYILIDSDIDSKRCIHGVFADFSLAEAHKQALAMQFTEDCLAEDPAESGLDESDRGWLYKECFNSLEIQEFEVIK